MAEFISVTDYMHFEMRIRDVYRYFREPHIDEFLSTVLSSARERLVTLSKGDTLWRAQLGHTEKLLNSTASLTVFGPGPFAEERMKPLGDRAKEGRANPKGIPHLYLATERETAMSEVRPGLASTISLASFELRRDLRVVDCTLKCSNVHPFRFTSNGEFQEPSPEERERVVWGCIDRAYSVPIDSSDDTAGYAPTQIIAEYFKSAGWDGIKYRSGYRSTGHNVVLFDVESAQFIECRLHIVGAINFEFREATE